MQAGLTKIAIDTAAVADGASIAAYVTDSAGTLIGSTSINGVVGINVSMEPNFADGTAWASGNLGLEFLAVRHDAGGPLTGVVDGSYSPLQLDSTGALRTTGAITFTAEHAEDSAAGNGDSGLFVLAVRNDDQASVTTPGNTTYAQFSVDDRGTLYTASAAARSNLQQVISVGTTALPLPAAPLAKRTSMFVQMLSGGQLYLGSSTVTNTGATRGMLLNQGGFVNVEVGPANLVYGIANAAAKDVVVWEFA